MSSITANSVLSFSHNFTRMKSFFESTDISDGVKRDVSFQGIVATRDLLSIAMKKSMLPTYESSIKVLYDLDPELYHYINKFISQRNDNDILKFYKEKAVLQSTIEGRNVTPSELIDKEINELQDLLANGVPVEENEDSDEEDGQIQSKVKFITNRLSSLRAAKASLSPRQINENRILQRDF